MMKADVEGFWISREFVGVMSARVSSTTASMPSFRGPVTVARTFYAGRNMRTPADAMTPAVIQPSTTMGLLAVQIPMTDFRLARRMMTTISGTATSPLMTALQNRAFMEFIGEYWIKRPVNTLTAMTP